jgi:hypothetical protein
VVRADALGRELDDVIREFTDLAGRRLPPLNVSLAAKKLAPLRVLPEEEWSKSQTQQQAGGEPPRLRGFR